MGKRDITVLFISLLLLLDQAAFAGPLGCARSWATILAGVGVLATAGCASNSPDKPSSKIPKTKDGKFLCAIVVTTRGGVWNPFHDNGYRSTVEQCRADARAYANDNRGKKAGGLAPASIIVKWAFYDTDPPQTGEEGGSL